MWFLGLPAYRPGRRPTVRRYPPCQTGRSRWSPRSSSPTSFARPFKQTTRHTAEDIERRVKREFGACDISSGLSDDTRLQLFAHASGHGFEVLAVVIIGLLSCIHIERQQCLLVLRLSPNHAVDVAMVKEEDGIKRGGFVFAHVTVAPHYLRTQTTTNDREHACQELKVICRCFIPNQIPNTRPLCS